MNCFAKFGMCVLIILNLIFMGLGGTIIYGGLLLKSEGASVGGDYLNMLNDRIFPILEQIGIGPSFNMKEILEMVVIVIMAVGGSIGGVAFLGFCGACCKWRPFLVLYAVIIICVCGAELVVMYFLQDMTTEFNETVKDKLYGLLASYEGELGGIITMAWNAVFVTFKCCGVNRQSTQDDFSKTKWGEKRQLQIIPGYCCKQATYLNGISLSDDLCAIQPTSDNSYYHEGCYTAIEESIETYYDLFVIGCGVALAVEAIAVIFSCCMCCEISNDKDKEKKRKDIIHRKTFPIA